jgi:hypothetical protein
MWTAICSSKFGLYKISSMEMVTSIFMDW